jgi:hypothetical protein
MVSAISPPAPAAFSPLVGAARHTPSADPRRDRSGRMQTELKSHATEGPLWSGRQEGNGDWTECAIAGGRRATLPLLPDPTLGEVVPREGVSPSARTRHRRPRRHVPDEVWLFQGLGGWRRTGRCSASPTRPGENTGIDHICRTGHEACLVGGQEKHEIRDVSRVDPGDRHGARA